LLQRYWESLRLDESGANITFRQRRTHRLNSIAALVTREPLQYRTVVERKEETPTGLSSSFKRLLISLALLSAIGACMCTAFNFFFNGTRKEVFEGGEHLVRDGESDTEDLADHKPLVC